MCGCCVFFFKQKTAYEILIIDWSSDVCSSDLQGPGPAEYAVAGQPERDGAVLSRDRAGVARPVEQAQRGRVMFQQRFGDRFGMNEVGRASCRERVCPYV